MRADKATRRERRRAARKAKTRGCPCGRPGCEVGRGGGGGVLHCVRVRREVRRGGLMETMG